MKSIFRSWTFWVNAVAMLAFLIQFYTGFAIEPEHQAAIMAFLNVVLRLKTSESIGAK